MAKDTFRATYKPLTEQQKERVANLKELAKRMEAVIGEDAQDHASAQALNRLEETVMWGTKALTGNP